MKRIALTDGSGRWFNAESATLFDEDTNWNGNNHISCATGSQFEHERLYRTRGGLWVLFHWSQWQGSTKTYSEINSGEAGKWMVINGHDSDLVREEIDSLEIK